MARISNVIYLQKHIKIGWTFLRNTFEIWPPKRKQRLTNLIKQTNLDFFVSTLEPFQDQGQRTNNFSVSKKLPELCSTFLLLSKLGEQNLSKNGKKLSFLNQNLFMFLSLKYVFYYCCHSYLDFALAWRQERPNGAPFSGFSVWLGANFVYPARREPSIISDDDKEQIQKCNIMCVFCHHFASYIKSY